jgi:hypothetical protein
MQASTVVQAMEYLEKALGLQVAHACFIMMDEFAF